MKPQFVYVVERDVRAGHPREAEGRPIVWEQYLDNGCADFERVQERANVHGSEFGNVRIARLAYIDEDADLADALDRIANLYDFEMTVGQAASAAYDARCIALAALAKFKDGK